MILAAMIAMQAVAPWSAPSSAPSSVVANAPARPLAPLLGPAPARRAIVLAAVRAEWPAYDGGAKGRLTPLEFSTWVLRAHGLAIAPADGQAPGIPPAKAMTATAAAFATADINHDGGVTQDEMVAFLTR